MELLGVVNVLSGSESSSMWMTATPTAVLKLFKTFLEHIFRAALTVAEF